MAFTRVHTRVVTTHRIPAYGGIQFDAAMLPEIAAAIASGSMPMHFGHDISRPLTIANIEAGVEQLDDGYEAVWAEFDVDSELWAAFESEVEAAGAPGGMSISVTAPLPGRSLTNTPGVVAADGHHFRDDEIDAAAAIFRQRGMQVDPEVLYQFSFEPIAKVIIDVVYPIVMALGPDIAASAIYDAAKSFFRRERRGIVFNVIFRESPRGTRKLKVHIEVSTEAELASALDRLPNILSAGASGTFISQEGGTLDILEGSSADEI